MILCNIAVGVFFLVRCARHGPSVIWTDAVHELDDTLEDLRADRVIALDWGFYDTLRLLSRGSLALTPGFDLFLSEEPSADMETAADRFVGPAGTVFVDHTPGNHVFSGVRKRFDAYVNARGLRERRVAEIRDRVDRAVFEIFCLEAADATGPGCLEQYRSRNGEASDFKILDEEVGGFDGSESARVGR